MSEAIIAAITESCPVDALREECRIDPEHWIHEFRVTELIVTPTESGYQAAVGYSIVVKLVVGSVTSHRRIALEYDPAGQFVQAKAPERTGFQGRFGFCWPKSDLSNLGSEAVGLLKPKPPSCPNCQSVTLRPQDKWRGKLPETEAMNLRWQYSRDMFHRIPPVNTLHSPRGPASVWPVVLTLAARAGTFTAQKMLSQVYECADCEHVFRVWFPKPASPPGPSSGPGADT